MRHAILALALLAPAAVAAPVPKSVKNKHTLDGRWVLVEQNYNGKDQPSFNKWMWVLDGTKLTYCRPDGGGKYVPSETDRTSSLTPVDGTDGAVDYVYESGKTTTVYKCMMTLNGDELVVCLGSGGAQGTRPAEAKPGASVQYFRFQRATDK